jgi:hypothetical protein
MSKIEAHFTVLAHPTFENDRMAFHKHSAALGQQYYILSFVKYSTKCASCAALDSLAQPRGVGYMLEPHLPSQAAQ